MMEWLQIDGSYGEGGGQIIRSAVALSTWLGRPIHLINIRAGRSNPGLQAQHLAAVLGARAVCDAEVAGASIGSRALRFAPRSAPQAGEYRIEVGTAGAATLVAQSLLLPLSHAAGPSVVEIRGGTHVAWSPPFHYLCGVFLPAARKLAGVRASAELKEWGWYPQGGGRMRLVVQPRGSAEVQRLVERGDLLRLHGYAATSRLPDHIRRRMRTRLRQRLYEHGLDADIELLEAPSPGPGAGVYLQADYVYLSSGFSGFGRRGKPAEQVVDEAIESFLAHHHKQGTVDPHLADQLIMLLIGHAGSQFTTTCVTRHLTTQIWLVEQFLGETFAFEGTEGTQGSVQCLN